MSALVVNDIIVAKKCTSCFEVLPMTDFAFRVKGMRYEASCRHCERRRCLADYHARTAANAAWPEHEVELLREHYPLGGTAACKPYLPKRSRNAIQTAARKYGLVYEGPRVSGTPERTVPEWAVPAHEYTEPDVAMREWRCAMPLTAMRASL